MKKTENIVAIIVGVLTIVGSIVGASMQLGSIKAKITTLEDDKFFQQRREQFRERLNEDVRILPQLQFPVPVGTVLPYYGNQLSEIPGFLFCNGQTITNSHYPRLTEHLRLTNLQAHRVEKSNELTKLPDLRGMFLRGLDSKSHRDPEGSKREIGDFQEESLLSHQHYVIADNEDNNNTKLYDKTSTNSIARAWNSRVGETPIEYQLKASKDEATLGLTSDETIENLGTETRPDNVAVNFIIKY